MTTVARGVCLTAFTIALVCGIERDRGKTGPQSSGKKGAGSGR
jgi:hypothetical protein